MMDQINKEELRSYVTEDGNYGSDEIITFPYKMLNEEQWEFLGELSDYDRLPFVRAVLEIDQEALREIYEEYGLGE